MIRKLFSLSSRKLDRRNSWTSSGGLYLHIIFNLTKLESKAGSREREMQRALIAPRPRISEAPYYSLCVVSICQLLIRWLIPWHYHQIDLQLYTYGSMCLLHNVLSWINVCLAWSKHCTYLRSILGIPANQVVTSLPMCISTPGSFKVWDVHMPYVIWRTLCKLYCFTPFKMNETRET